MKRYDLVVIGGGSGGLIAAEYAARLGSSVALVDKGTRLGGECLNNGCVPSKALIHAAKTFYRAATAGQFGVECYPELNFTKLKQSIVEAQDRVAKNNKNDEYYEKLGVDIFHEHARFVSTSKIKVGKNELEGKRFIVATGSRPRIPEIPGLAKTNFLTNETIFDIDKPPKRLAVIGGGVIGCEIASAYSQIGSQVTIFERYDHLSLRVDKPIAEFVQDNFRKRGMKIHTNSNTLKVSSGDKGIKLDFDSKGETTHQFFDAIFVSTGRTANLDLGLDNAGVKYTDNAITIDKYGRTNNKKIWAIGDVTGTAGFTHVAEEQALYAVLHALFGYSKEVRLNVLPYVIYTTPEVAHVGKTAKELEDSKISFTTRTLDYSEIDRASIENKTGLIQVLLNKKEELLGATMVGSHATEQIGQYVMAMNFGLKLRDFGRVLQPYPTYAMATKQMAVDLTMEKALESKLADKAMRAAQSIRRLG